MLGACPIDPILKCWVTKSSSKWPSTVSMTGKCETSSEVLYCSLAQQQRRYVHTPPLSLSSVFLSFASPNPMRSGPLLLVIRSCAQLIRCRVPACLLACLLDRVTASGGAELTTEMSCWNMMNCFALGVGGRGRGQDCSSNMR